MNRFLVFAGAFALAAAQPLLSLAAPTGGSARARPVSAQPSHASTPSRSVDRVDRMGPIVPAHFDGAMKPLAMPQHFAMHNALQFSPLPVSSYRRFALVPARGYLWYPTLYSPACTGNFAPATTDKQPSGFTLGSLSGGKSDLLSSKNYGTKFAEPNGADTTTKSSGLSFQASVVPAGCGPSAFTNF